MLEIQNLIKRNSIFILHIFCTSILCVLIRIFLGKFPDYLLFANLLLALLTVYCFYRMIFKKIYSDSFLKIICILAMAISANKLYSYNKIKKVFPIIANIDNTWLIIGVILILLVLLLIFKLLTYIEPSNNDNTLHKNSDIISDSRVPTSSIEKVSHKEFFSFMNFLCVFAAFCIVMLIPAILLYLFNKYGLDKSALEIDKVFSFLASYGASFLLILCAIIVAIITLISVAKYIYIQIISFKKINNEDESKAYPVPTYAFSIIIVFIILFLTWRVTDFSLDDLTETLTSGNYLAFPITVIVTMILFFLLVQITHAIILMLSKISAADVKDFIEAQEKKLKIGSRIIEIIAIVVNIILDTILSTLKFVEFVPNFFNSLYKMILLDDEDSVDEEI